MDLQNIFLTIWNMSLTGSIIIGFVLMARLILRKAPKVFSYALWAVVLFRLLCPVSISSALSVLNFAKGPEAVSGNMVTIMDYSVLDVPLMPIVEEKPAVEEEPVYHVQEQEITVIPENRTEVTPTPDAEGQQAAAEPVREPVYYAVIIWLVGLGVMAAYNAYGCIRLFRQIEGATPLRKGIYLADYIPTAFVLGIIRPRIFLPSYLAVGERGYIIAHERCHIKRKDHIFRLLAYLALCLHWFNPLVWLAFILSGKDMEMSCDEAVIRMYGPRIRAEYSTSLLRLATGHRSFALTPLAFGEGDTKGRVINMSKWKKPRLWVVICALIVCIAVLVACAVNPAKETEPEDVMKEPTVLAPTEATHWDKNVDVKQVCIDTIDELLNAESYFFRYESEVMNNAMVMEYRRHGEDYLIQVVDNAVFGSRLLIDGKGASFYGDYWVWGEIYQNNSPNDFLSRLSPANAETSHFTVSEDAISYDATWPDLFTQGRYHEGTLTFTFNPDGSLLSIEREYVTKQGDELVSGAVDKIIPIEEAPEDTYAAIKAVADQCITSEALEQFRLEAKTVSEIPSNKTSFDTNYELGSVQMRWYFFGEDWQFAFGAEDATPTSTTLVHLESSDGHKSLVAEESFWLEQLVDGKWQYLDENKIAVSAEKRNVDVAWDKKDCYEIDWSDSYGALEPGFYRLGRYYTVTMESGESETRPCYAKFRILGENWEELLTKCEDALEELLNRDAYHLVHETYLTEHADSDQSGYLPWIIVSHIYKSGKDFLQDARYLDRENHDLWLSRRGSMLRDGQSYSLEWTGREVDTPLSAWSRLDYSGTYDLWESTFEWYDSSIVDVVEIGQEISILMELGEYGHGHKYREVRFYFNSDGSIHHIDNLYHPTEGITKMRDKVVEDILIVEDTPAEDIRNLIESQDVSKPIPFTYEMDVEEYPDAKKEGFVNTEHRTVGDMETAIRLADKECTMSVQDTISGERYNITEVFYDETAKIWKVVFRYSQNTSGDQAIYLDNRGITQMIVTYTENDPQ